MTVIELKIERKQKREKPPYEGILKDLSLRFEQTEEAINKAFLRAGNFDTLIMFCMASKEMGIPVDEIAEMSLHTKIPQMYLKSIRPQEETNDGKPRTRVTRLKRDRGSQQSEPKDGVGGSVL